MNKIVTEYKFSKGFSVMRHYQYCVFFSLLFPPSVSLSLHIMCSVSIRCKILIVVTEKILSSGVLHAV